MYRPTRKLETGKPFAFSLFRDLHLVVSQIGNEMEDVNVRFSIRRKGQYSRIAFCVKITQLFILSYLTTPLKMLLYPFLETRPLFIFSSSIDENTDTVHLIEVFLF